MFNKNSLPILPLLVVGLCCTTVPAAASAPFNDFKFGTPERIDFTLDTAYSKTEGNFEKSGNTFTKLPSGSAYSTYDFDMGIRAEVAPNINLYGSGRITSADSQNTVYAGSPQTKSNTGLSHGTAGMDFVLVSGRLLVIPDFSVTVPGEAVDRSANSKTALGEGVLEANGRVVLRVERRSYRFGGYAGVTYRDGGRSTIAPYGALFELTLGKWNIGMDVRGYQSLNYDKDTDRETLIDSTYFCPANGCSKRFGAFNPSQMESNLWVRINASPEFAFHFGGGMDWSGSNVSRDATFFGGITYRWSYAGMRQSTPQQKEIRSFEETLDDGIDQRAFEQGTRSMTPPVVPTALEETPQKKARPKAPRRPREKTVNIQDELDKTEMQMEQNSTTTSPE